MFVACLERKLKIFEVSITWLSNSLTRQRKKVLQCSFLATRKVIFALWKQKLYLKKVLIKKYKKKEKKLASIFYPRPSTPDKKPKKTQPFRRDKKKFQSGWAMCWADSSARAHTWGKVHSCPKLFNMLNIRRKWHARRNSHKTAPHTWEICLRQLARVKFCSADSSSVRRA